MGFSQLLIDDKVVRLPSHVAGALVRAEMAASKAKDAVREAGDRVRDLQREIVSHYGVQIEPTPGRAAGGVARAGNLSPARRVEIARKAAQARWGKS